MTEKKYIIQAPAGSIVAPQGAVSENVVRSFALQIIQDADAVAVWSEKIEKDPIADILDFLRGAGYGIIEL